MIDHEFIFDVMIGFLDGDERENGALGKDSLGFRPQGMVLENWLQQTGWSELAAKGYRVPGWVSMA
jgi:hypothetical protein